MRSGALATPETFANVCPWCGLGTLDRWGGCEHCRSKLRCSGFGVVGSRVAHACSCWEVACDLRYVPEAFDWSRVLRAYDARGEAIDWRARSDDAA